MFLACLKLSHTYPEEMLETLGPALDGLCVGYYASREEEGNDDSPWLMRWIMEDAPDVADISLRLKIWAEAQNLDVLFSEVDWSIEKIDENRDWLAESYKGFQPFTVGKFYIYGSHYDGELPAGTIPLMIDAATAFGSGEHPTTEGCLELLCQLKDEGYTPQTILDVGCGSGILAIAAAKLWPEANIIATDIDPESVTVTNRHAEMNDLSEGRVVSAAADGFECDLITQSTPFDLVMANILAGPLKGMACDLAKTLHDQSKVILSGLLNEQAGELISVYTSHNLTLERHLEIKEWSSLCLKSVKA